MKTFNNVQEWLAEKPKKDELESVLTFINRKAITTARKELYQVERALKWYDKIKKDFAKHGIKKLSPEIEESHKAQLLERDELLKILPPKKVIVKKAGKDDNESVDKSNE